MATERSATAEDSERRYLVDRHRHFVDRRRGAGDFLRLVLGGFGQVHRGGLGFLGRCGHLHGGLVDGLHQFAELVDGVIDRVGDGAGEVLGHGRGHGQVAVREVGDLVEQTQDRGLVAVVLLGGLGQPAVGLAHHHQADQDDRGQGQGAEDVTGEQVDATPAGQVLEAVGQLRGLVQQGLRNAEDVVRRFPDLEQVGRGLEDLVHRTGDELEEFGDLVQAIHRLGVGHLGDAHRRVAFLHALQYAAEQAGVAAEAVGGLHRVLVAGQHLVHRAEDTFGEQRLALGDRDLVGRGTVLQQDVDHLFVFHLQLRDGFGEGRGHLVQGQYSLFAGEDGVGVLAQAIPVLLHHVHLRLHRFGAGRQGCALVAVDQDVPAFLEVVARILQELERLALARRRFGGVLRDPLRQDAQFAGMADVLLVMVRLGVEVGKVGEQQHDRDDEDDEQPRDHRAAAHAREKIACVDFLHIWPPPGPTTITISMSRHGPADRPNR